MMLRPAAEADVGRLVSLLQRSWLATFAADLPFEAVQTFAQEDPARRYAEAMWSAFMVAELDGTVVGMCHVVDDLVAAVHVDPAMKRRGIGAALMDAAEADIFGRFVRARLEVLAFNTSAQAFYRQRGWQDHRLTSTDECGVSIEAIEMVKDRG